MSWSSFYFYGMLLIVCVMITTCSGKYSAQISMEDIHGYDNQVVVPFINNLNYLKKLSSYASSENIKNALVLLGPKDSANQGQFP